MNIDKLREKLLKEAIKLAPEQGWTKQMLQNAAINIKEEAPMADILFPKGVMQALALMAKNADNAMQAKLKGKEFASMKVRDKITFALKTRFEQQLENKQAIKAAISVLIKPQNIMATNRLTWATVSSIWYAAGDKSADLNHYSKRLILGYIYRMAVLKWIKTEGNEATFELIDEKIANVMKFEKAKAQYKQSFVEYCDKFNQLDINALKKDVGKHFKFGFKPSGIVKSAVKRKISRKASEYYEYFSKRY